MDAVSYPDTNVIGFIMEHMIPIRVRYDQQPYAKEYNITWTPTIVTIGTDGNEHHRTVGFLGPEELIPSLMLGIGKYHFDRGRFADALSRFETIVKTYSQSNAAPEAIYLRGVSAYKESNVPQPLKEAYEQLNKEYPDSEWTKRAYPYRLL